MFVVLVILVLVLSFSAVLMQSCGKKAGVGTIPEEEEEEVTNKLVNAWILLDEDQPSGANYNTPGSCYQTLISNEVYKSVDILFICFATTEPTSLTSVPTGDGSTYTIRIQDASNPHPGGLTNQDYMNYVIRDAHSVNPNIKIAMTLDWGDGTLISRIFSSSKYTTEETAARFADNLMYYLKYYNLDGFDIDWEWPLSTGTTQDQFRYLINAIGSRFSQEAQQTGKKYYLTISPATTDNLNAAVINQYVDFLNLQLYGGASRDEFINAGINPNLLAYGAKFESKSPWDPTPYQSAEAAYMAGKDYYTIFTNWRLNSGDFDYEQDQQKQLHNWVYYGHP